MNDQTKQLLEALQKTQAILGNRTLDQLSDYIFEAVDQYAENKKLIDRLTAER